MIRINLLPVRQVRRARVAQRQLALFATIVAVELLALVILGEMKSKELEQKKRQVSILQVDIERMKRDVGDFDTMRNQRDKLVKQRTVINSLNSGRTGPVVMLRELSEILTTGKGPTVDQNQYDALLRRDPYAGFNARWNPRRLWIEQIEQKGQKLAIIGKAKDHDDVAEFLRRLTLSAHFADVQLNRNDQVSDSGLRLIKFSLACRAVF